ncbi:P-loop NTPase family protein [Rhizobium ruizarguesonis]|uniref:hypothetical protein n=1 Tax=Rhizobium ruizarguesonis TaxID=2081791 RepID=UPI0010302EBD|nr:hypothetical protein [Rhizobium ruizarguesonis]TBA92813.1 hypothetical protein ELH54_24705 [Rhizobium ruizarguesonis]
MTNVPLSSLIRPEILTERLRACPLTNHLLDPAGGDLVLCEVIDDEGPYPAVETSPAGGLQLLSRGMKFVGVLGTRESAVNVTGRIPDRPLLVGDSLHLLAVGGLVGIAEYIPGVASGRARSLVFAGAFEDEARQALNLRNYPLFRRADYNAIQAIEWRVVCGSSAEVGKTTLVERLLEQAVSQCAQFGAVKLTGTGRMKDCGRFTKAGAKWVGDFTDAGLETTYSVGETNLKEMVARVATAAIDRDVRKLFTEFGGDLLEAGVPSILPILKAVGARFAFVAADAMGAAKALEILGSDADVSIVTRGGNLRALERRLGVARVYNCDASRDLADLCRHLNRKGI